MRRLISALVTFVALLVVPVTVDTVEPVLIGFVLLVIIGTLAVDLVIEKILHK